MQERTFRVNLGDWSSDGHGIHETLILRLRGEDVSDEAISDAYEKSVEDFGRDLGEVCSDFDDCRIDRAYYSQLLAAGFTHAMDEDPWPGIQVAGLFMDPEDEDSEVRFGPEELLMFYVGRHLENFSWEPVEEDIPVLIGGFGTVIKQKTRGYISSSFGYGLFSP